MEKRDQKGRRTKRLPEEEQAMVSGGAKLFHIVVAIIAEVVRLGGAGKFAQLDKPVNKTIVTEIAEMLVGKVAAPMVQVAWNIMLTWIIAACKFVSYVHPDITAEHFPLQPGDLTIKEVIDVAIPRAMSTPEVLKFLNKKGLRPATLIELLWWWITNPSKQSNCLVVALGSVWDGDVPCVNGLGDDRGLYLSTVGDGWDTGCTFAAVSKSAAKAAA